MVNKGVVLRYKISEMVLEVDMEKVKVFDFELKERKGYENQVVDHLSILEAEKRDVDELEIDESFLDEQVLATTPDLIP
ncbi:hypothetical protein MTR67_040089 [Solanum verrucosum]|uniref:Uncharacterized protein n=1 Tax=Solanum verrucosum TaxID=315347 RepID=A0AAF0UIX7_SOLVR|nr:hypothetical protein MTR67_040089 [Solanum verrucosum]